MRFVGRAATLPHMKFLLALTVLALGCGDDSMAPLDAGSDATPDTGSDATADVGVDAEEREPPRVETASGPVVGDYVAGVREFLGIPYAAPPIGDLRFAPPTAPAPWTEPLDATERPARCHQAALGVTLPGDEDCLVVNVHTPDPMPENAPVMVWIHGGAFIFGEGLQTENGTKGDVLAHDHGVVVVSMNYRLGAFGFLAHPDGATGNYGLMDQRMALEWVRDNIAAFGGDPDNVTIVGESAGGISVCAHMVSPASQELFARAISESGLCGDAWPTLEEMQSLGAELATSLGCTEDVMACLRSKTPEEILGSEDFSVTSLLQGGNLWWINVDGDVIPGDFVSRVATGDVADVPMLLGWNGDEGTLFILLAEQSGEVVDEAAYEEIMPVLAEQYDVDEGALRAQYPLADYEDAGFAIADALGDAKLACASRRAAEAIATRARNVYVYHFLYPDADFLLSGDRELGAFHSAEVQFVFGHPGTLGARRFRADEVPITDAMSAYWTSFATDGDPNYEGGVTWPVFDLEGDANLVIDRSITASTGADRDVCALFE